MNIIETIVRRKTLCSILHLRDIAWILSSISISFTYPLQVISQSPSYVVIPLFVVVLSILINRLPYLHFNDLSSAVPIPVRKGLHYFLIWFTIGVFILNSIVRELFSYDPSLSSLYPIIYWVFLFIIVFIYFSTLATVREINMFLLGCVVVAILGGLFFAYDSFHKLVLGEVSQYSVMAEIHNINRLDKPLEEANLFRIQAMYRSFGLLERHSVSAYWIMLGFFSFSFLRLNQHKSIDKWVFCLIGVLLLAGDNFTSLLAWAGVVLLLYRKYLDPKFIILLLLVALVTLYLLWFNEHIQFVTIIFDLLKMQIGYLLNYQETNPDIGWMPILLDEVHRFYELIISEPWILLFGYGIGAHAEYGTSSDIGLFETLARLGLPLFVVIVIYILRVVCSALKWLKYRSLIGKNIWFRSATLFSASVFLSVFIMDVHYSVWMFKSIAPILAFAMAVENRVPAEAVSSIVES